MRVSCVPLVSPLHTKLKQGKEDTRKKSLQHRIIVLNNKSDISNSLNTDGGIFCPSYTFYLLDKLPNTLYQRFSNFHSLLEMIAHLTISHWEQTKRKKWKLVKMAMKLAFFMCLHSFDSLAPATKACRDVEDA